MADIQSGQVFFALLAGVVVALPVTAAFLALYRRAVARTMRVDSRAGGIAEPEFARVGPGASGRAPVPDADGLRRVARRTRRGIALAYAGGFAVGAAVLHAPVLHELWAASGDGLGLLRAFAGWFPVWSATLFVVAALLHLGRRQAWTLVGVALVGGAALSVLLPAAVRLVVGAPFGPELLANAGWFGLAFALNAALPALLVWITGRPRLRNVMPMTLVLVMSLSLVVAAVYHLYVSLFAASGPLEPTPIRRAAMAVGPTVLILLLALPAGWLAWRGTGALATRYRARRFSDMQLLGDAWWAVIVAFALASPLWQYGAWLALACACAGWLSFFVTVRLLLRAQGLGSGAGGPSLLLLRVFGHQARTERLFDTVAAHWRFSGPVAMIAGADLALRSVDVDEALAFAHGEIESGYIADRAGLDRRLERLQGRTDPDGRYRVEEFFCFDDTWRATLQALLGRCRIVLMDLRGFTSDNAGCVFELEQLGRLGQLHRCLFIADRHTDRALAGRSLSAGSAVGGRPTADGLPTVRWIDLPGDDEAGLQRLRGAMFEVASA
jgi:hypothetical protein